jgi:hypothetical protein
MHARTLAGAPDKTTYSNTSLRFQISDVNALVCTRQNAFTCTISLSITFERTHNGRLLTLMLMWTHVLAHYIIHERLHAGRNAQPRSCPQQIRGFTEHRPRQRGSYFASCEHLRNSVEEDTHLNRGIGAALLGHLRRSVFVPPHRRLGTKGRSLKSRCAATSKKLLYTCAESSNTLRLIKSHTFMCQDTCTPM